MRKDVKAQTTVKQFEKFKKNCLKWQKVFNLQGVTLEFALEDLDDAHANSFYHFDGHVAIIKLNKNILLSGEDSKPKNMNEMLDEWACHEMFHILTGDVDHMISARYIREEEGLRAIERLVCDLTSIAMRLAKK
jgi:hypothetical protein